MSNIESPQFADMPIGKLREYAKHMRVALAKTDTKEEIIEALNRKLRDRTVTELATPESEVKPGYAKIRLMQDPMPDAQNYPVYVNANGYVCTIPRGIDVIVPMRVVRTLQDAQVKRKKQSVANINGREQFSETEITSPSYPFQVIEMVPGPEVLTALEQTKLRTIGPRRRYRDIFGRWPRPKDLTRAIEQGLIKLENDELLGTAAAGLSREDALGYN